MKMTGLRLCIGDLGAFMNHVHEQFNLENNK
jgi:hypothetical protein